MLIFKILVRPILLYAAPVWIRKKQSETEQYHQKKNFNLLEKLQYKSLQSIGSACFDERNTDLRKKLNINTMEE